MHIFAHDFSHASETAETMDVSMLLQCLMIAHAGQKDDGV